MPWAYAPPVSSGPFFLHPTRGLYVIIDHEIYVQESRNRIHQLVTYKDPGPVLNKAGKPKKHQPPPHQDESTRFYMAQLQLYGLEPVNSKKAAKKALLAAFQAPGGLYKSEEVIDIHLALSREYREKNKVAEEEYKSQKRLERSLRKEAKAEETKKRQRDEGESGMEVQAPSSKKSKSNKKSKRLGISKLSDSSKTTVPKVSEESEVSEPLPLQLAPSSAGEHAGKHEDGEGAKCGAENEKGGEE